MPRLTSILKHTALSLLTLGVGFVAFAWIYDNTPLGCYVEEEYPALKPGTPEYAAMQAAARQIPRSILKISSTGLDGIQTYRYGGDHVFRGDDQEYSVKKDGGSYWFIAFHPRHEKSFFGCQDAHMDGEWIAIVRKSDLMLMNPDPR